MQVRFLMDWNGWKKGHSYQLPDGVANLLCERFNPPRAEYVDQADRPKRRQYGTNKRAYNQGRVKSST